MDRRTLLKTGGLGLLGLGFGGCAKRPVRTSPTRPVVNLAPVRASWDRVIRTTVGLRPHRPSGFVVRAEKLDDKTLVHNYGHGGAGHSLGWGTGLLAAELALQQESRQAAVIGCGTVGLTSARQLQRRGFDVTIYTMAVPPNTTSNMAWAGYTPTSGLVAVGRRTPAWDAQFRRAAEIGYRQFQFLVGPRYGISWIDDYSLLDEGAAPRTREGRSRLLPAKLQTGRVILQPGEHPFPSTYASRGTRIRIEPSIYLEALMRDVLLFGGRIVIRKFETPRDLMTLHEPLIVNCTALGSRDLFDDEELIPVKGQLTFLVPQPEVNYTVNGVLHDSNGQLMQVSTMPRHDGIALGHTAERNVWTLEPNEEAIRRTMEAHIALYNGMRAPIPGARLTRLETPREAPRLESFFGLES